MYHFSTFIYATLLISVYTNVVSGANVLADRLCSHPDIMYRLIRRKPGIAFLQ